MSEIILWAIAFVVLTIAELCTYQLVSIWFALGSLVSLICAILGLGILGQIIVFTVFSVLLLIATRPFVKKVLKNRIVPTNAELDIGKIAIVIEKINNTTSTGRVKLNGVDWAARSSDDSTIPAGTSVTVEKIEGSKLIVKK